MRQRCENPNNMQFRIYGGRGISVCDEWQDPCVFVAWGLANGFEPGLTIDRIDNDKGYAPANCRFATRSEQGKNTRRCAKVYAFGEVNSYSGWSRDSRARANAWKIRDRILKGWQPEKAITTPPENNGEQGQ